MAKENNIRAIKFLNWYFLRIALDDLDFTKPLKWEGGQGSSAVQIAVDGSTTVEGYSVPSPTAEELTAIYNAVVAGNNVQIVDSNDIYYQVILADSMAGAINVELMFFGKMVLTYTLENETVSITANKLCCKKEIALTGDSGILTAQQIEDIQNNDNIVELNCDGQIFRLTNKNTTLSYRTFINADCALESTIQFSVIYIQLNPEAVNYGHWNKENITPAQ